MWINWAHIIAEKSHQTAAALVRAQPSISLLKMSEALMCNWPWCLGWVAFEI